MKKTIILLLILLSSHAKDISSDDKKIFIIGDSTVHNSMSKTEMGWGDALGEYALYPKNIFNLAREGSSSKSYKVCSSRAESCYKNRNWDNTKKLMKSMVKGSSAYLLIQFGHNDEDESRVDVYTTAKKDGSFYRELKVFVDEAREMGITPILVTPVERMRKERGQKMRTTHTRSDGDYSQRVRDLATDEGLLLIDLQKKSLKTFDKYSDRVAIMRDFAFDDTTHFSPKGAKIVAGWVIELGCQTKDRLFCSQFK